MKSISINYYSSKARAAFELVTTCQLYSAVSILSVPMQACPIILPVVQSFVVPSLLCPILVFTCSVWCLRLPLQDALSHAAEVVAGLWNVLPSRAVELVTMSRPDLVEGEDYLKIGRVTLSRSPQVLYYGICTVCWALAAVLFFSIGLRGSPRVDWAA